MSEIKPITPDLKVIRTYDDTYYAETDSEVEQETHFENDLEEENQSISTRLRQNQDYFDTQLEQQTGTNSAWTVSRQPWKTADEKDVILIKRPTASCLSHRLLNPYIYRNIKDVGSLDNLASLLEAPNDWESIYKTVVAKRFVVDKLNQFIALPDSTLEATIQNEFNGIVHFVSAALGSCIFSKSQTKVIVGGILARHEYDLRSATDPHFFYKDNVDILASEIKTQRSFPLEDMWYHGSRGIQTLSALYSYNCPTLLLTQKHWKLFIENKDRNAVFTYPFNDNKKDSDYFNSTLMYSMGATFLKVIVICLLSKRGNMDERMRLESEHEVSQLQKSPAKKPAKRKHDEDGQNQRVLRRSSRLKPLQEFSSSSYSRQKKMPIFISGYENGLPIYSTIRVVSEDVVARIETEIEEELALEKKNLFQKQASDATLCE